LSMTKPGSPIKSPETLISVVLSALPVELTFWGHENLVLIAMGHVRKRPTLLSKKLLAIREFLSASQADMANRLEYEILLYSRRQYPLKPARISEYENRQREPNLFVLIAYGRLAKVHLESLVDDEVNLETFRSRRGKEVDYALRRRKTE